MKPRPRVGLLVVVSVAAGVHAVETPESEGLPLAITAQQIEADWFHQDDLRGRGAISGPTVAPAEDARGGCDGVKNGQWGFHTAYEADPWWQIDLGQSRPLERILLYNRCDLAERVAPGLST